MNISTIDLIVFGLYVLGIISLGLWVSRSKKGHTKDSQDYFLAGRNLPWWAIGSSLIAANISAEQFIGMSGSGFAIGLAIASYEWMAAATLLIVAKFFLPIYIKKGIYTMPGFLEQRYDKRVRTSLAIFWTLLIVFVNLTTVLYLASLALGGVMNIPFGWAVAGLAAFAAIYSLYGGMQAVAWTDVIQVTVLVIGGLITSYLALTHLGAGNGLMQGINQLIADVPEKFQMILSKDNPNYKELPGLTVLLGGLWIANLYYWGCNQYIIQGSLAAKNIGEAQKGLVFAAYLKMLLPLIVVIPGIVAYSMHADLAKPDEAYPWVMNRFVPIGIKGLALAALVAAAASSLSAMANSVSTIFTMDIYKPWINKNASEANLVKTGRLAAGTAFIIAILIAPLLQNLSQAFQFIQKYTGFVSPGVFAIFLFGLFWKRTTANAALMAAIITIPLSAFIDKAFPTIPFLDQMGICFLIISGLIIAFSMIESKVDNPKAVDLSSIDFKTSRSFNIGAVGVIILLIILYWRFW
ncbi:MAG: sodium/sugar symporter [Saprospiraceae bacterium]